MDIKLISLQKNKLQKPSSFSIEEQNKYLDDFLYLGLGLKIIVKNYKLTDEINDTIDYLCIDETYRLVIVEKRYGKNTRIIKSGLLFIDYIKEHISQIKLLISDTLGSDIIKDICFDCRLVILTQSFSNYDFSSIKCLPYNIEAINYFFLDKNLLFVKEYQNTKKDFKNYRGKVNSLYMYLEDILLSLGDDVTLFGYQNIISVRKIKAFLYIIIKEDSIIIYLNNKEHIIKNDKDLYKLEIKIEKAYDEN